MDQDVAWRPATSTLLLPLAGSAQVDLFPHHGQEGDGRLVEVQSHRVLVAPYDAPGDADFATVTHREAAADLASLGGDHAGGAEAEPPLGELHHLGYGSPENEAGPLAFRIADAVIAPTVDVHRRR